MPQEVGQAPIVAPEYVGRGPGGSEMAPENTARFFLCQDHQEAPASSLQLEPSRESPWSRISLPSTLGFLRMKLKGLSRNSTTSPSPEGGTWTPLTGKFEWGFWESTATSVLRKTAGRGGGRLGDRCRSSPFSPWKMPPPLQVAPVPSCPALSSWDPISL